MLPSARTSAYTLCFRGLSAEHAGPGGGRLAAASAQPRVYAGAAARGLGEQ